MRCKKCGKRLRKTEKFCTYCGYYNGEVDSTDWDADFEEVSFTDEEEPKKKKTKEDNGDFEVSEKTKSKEEDFYYENEDLLEAYIGEDYKLIKKAPFNIYAFLLNFSYLLYRKLYITGIIGLIITAVIIIFFRGILIPYIVIALLLLGFGFNYYYVFIAKKRIEKIMRDYEGSDKFSLQTICEEKGGVNLWMALGIYFIFILVIFFSFVRIDFNREHNAKYWQENTENKATCMSLVKLSYGDLANYKVPGKIEEAVCKISKANFTEFDVYLKTSKGNKEYYTYYQTEGDGLLYKDNTSRISSLEKKKADDKITDDEQAELNTLKQMEGNFKDIKKQSEVEDELIKKKRNKSEKLNYYFNKEEIIR